MTEPLLIVKVRGAYIQIPEEVISDEKILETLLDAAQQIFDYGLKQIEELKSSSQEATINE